MALKVGIIGCGTIGSQLGRAITAETPELNLVALSDIEEQKARELAQRLPTKPQVLPTDELIDRVDLVVEAASKEIVAEIVEKALRRGRDIVVMSTGGLLGKENLFNLAKEKNCRIYLPSGALAGLDGIKSAAAGGIDSVTLTTRKPPAGLKGAPYVLQKRIDLNSIKEERLIFEGTADEAVEGFPQNINVAATVSLAGIGPQKTKVRIIADPNTDRNTHQIEVEGKFGKLTSTTENLPSPSNPKTSFLAALSAIATLKGAVARIRVGT